MDNRSIQSQRSRKGSIYDKNKKTKKKKKPKKASVSSPKNDKARRSDSTDEENGNVLDISGNLLAGAGTGWDSVSNQVMYRRTAAPSNQRKASSNAPRGDLNKISGVNSLRWENEIDNESAEEARLEQYKMNRRKRYLAAKNISYSEWMARDDTAENDTDNDAHHALPDVVTSTVPGMQTSVT